MQVMGRHHVDGAKGLHVEVSVVIQVEFLWP
jgi:hypothetical protein